MLSFKKVSPGDIDLLRPYFFMQNSRICDYTISGCVLWRDYYNIEFAISDNTLIFKETSIYDTLAFTFPIGKNIDHMIDEVFAYCKANNIPVEFCNVPEEGGRYLKKKFPAATGRSERDWCDYLYNASDLITLSGKKYSGQRNHINRFKSDYEYSFNQITPENAASVKNFYNQVEVNSASLSGLIVEEEHKVNEMLDHYDAYGLLGGYLSIGEKIVAMAIGDIVNDTLFVHIERADTAYHGAYQMIVNEFAKHFSTKDVLYVNREEDMGVEGLRISKMSYHPYRLLKKCVIKIN